MAEQEKAWEHTQKRNVPIESMSTPRALSTTAEPIPSAPAAVSGFEESKAPLSVVSGGKSRETELELELLLYLHSEKTSVVCRSRA